MPGTAPIPAFQARPCSARSSGRAAPVGIRRRANDAAQVHDGCPRCRRKPKAWLDSVGQTARCVAMRSTEEPRKIHPATSRSATTSSPACRWRRTPIALCGRRASAIAPRLWARDSPTRRPAMGLWSCSARVCTAVAKPIETVKEAPDARSGEPRGRSRRLGPERRQRCAARSGTAACRLALFGGRNPRSVEDHITASMRSEVAADPAKLFDRARRSHPRARAVGVAGRSDRSRGFASRGTMSI